LKENKNLRDELNKLVKEKNEIKNELNQVKRNNQIEIEDLELKLEELQLDKELREEELMEQIQNYEIELQTLSLNNLSSEDLNHDTKELVGKLSEISNERDKLKIEIENNSINKKQLMNGLYFIFITKLCIYF
jgi:predicted nuclease with TOPRIM domain